MTKLLETAIEAAKQLSPEEQDELARTILAIVDGERDDVYMLSEDERAAIQESSKQADRGEFATDEEVEALFANYHP